MLSSDRLKWIRLFLNTARNNLNLLNGDKKTAGVDLLNQTEAQYAKFITALMQTPLIGKKPLDPFIAGGFAEAIGGVGVGVVTALNQAQKQNAYEETVQDAQRSAERVDWEGKQLEKQFASCEKFFLSNHEFKAVWDKIAQEEKQKESEQAKCVEHCKQEQRIRIFTGSSIAALVMMAISIFAGGSFGMIMAPLLGIFVVIMCLICTAKQATPQYSEFTCSNFYRKMYSRYKNIPLVIGIILFISSIFLLIKMNSSLLMFVGYVFIAFGLLVYFFGRSGDK